MNHLVSALPRGPASPRVQRWSRRRLLASLDTLEYGTLLVQFGGGEQQAIEAPRPGPSAHLRVHDAAGLLRRVVVSGDLGFAQAYIDGLWSSNDLATLLYLLSKNLDRLRNSDRRSLPVRWLSRLQHALRRNSLRGSRRNIAAHYDLGNDFYARWLDGSMSYSGAVFSRPGEPLQQAQQNKYRLMLQRIDARPGQQVLEIGCGWGGFAEQAARFGLHVTGVTLSREQLAYAEQRVQQAGLGDQVDLQLRDYRDLHGQFDHVVSIEMFEAVGRRYWQRYFEILHDCLKPGGRAALQVITISGDLFEDYVRQAGGFIQRHIFPGGMLPTERHLAGHAASAGFDVLAVDRYGTDYADTLAAWWRAFQGETAWLEQHGYDERFRRMWHYYLAFCEAGFRDGRIDLVQLTLHKPTTCTGDD